MKFWFLMEHFLSSTLQRNFNYPIAFISEEVVRLNIDLPLATHFFFVASKLTSIKNFTTSSGASGRSTEIQWSLFM